MTATLQRLAALRRQREQRALEALTVETSPGHHELYVTTDGRVRSQPVALDIAAGSTAQALCASPRNPFANLYRIIFRPSHTIALSVG